MFQQTLGEFAPRFVSRTQEDAQEFLTFLLDGLHEDLNKATGLTEDLQLMLTKTENTSIDQVYIYEGVHLSISLILLSFNRNLPQKHG